MKPFVTENWNPLRKTKQSIFTTNQLFSPTKWTYPRIADVCSIDDLFGTGISYKQIDKVIAIIAASQKHTFIISTHHARRMNLYFNKLVERSQKMHSLVNPVAALLQATSKIKIPNLENLQWPLPNLRIGITVQNQHQYFKDIGYLLETPAIIRFLNVNHQQTELDLNGYLDLTTAKETVLQKNQIDWIICNKPMKLEFAKQLQIQSNNLNIPFYYYHKNKTAELFGKIYDEHPNDYKLQRLLQIIQTDIDKQPQRTPQARLKRRYYLHSKVKQFTRVEAPTRQISVNDRILNEASATELTYLIELGKMGYNLQNFIE